MLTVRRSHEIVALAGQELATTRWVEISTRRVNLFAEATGDRHWVHLDQDRASKGPFGSTVAHGFLVMSLIGELWPEVVRLPESAVTVNLGTDRVRFVAPVPVGDAVRATVRLHAADQRADSIDLTVDYEFSKRSDGQLACVARHRQRLFLPAETNG